MVLSGAPWHLAAGHARRSFGAKAGWTRCAETACRRRPWSPWNVVAGCDDAGRGACAVHLQGTGLGYRRAPAAVRVGPLPLGLERLRSRVPPCLEGQAGVRPGRARQDAHRVARGARVAPRGLVGRAEAGGPGLRQEPRQGAEGPQGQAARPAAGGDAAVQEARPGAADDELHPAGVHPPRREPHRRREDRAARRGRARCHPPRARSGSTGTRSGTGTCRSWWRSMPSRTRKPGT
jgi:hypothetical protein